MNAWLHQLGIGAVLAWVALPLLAWSVGRAGRQEPGSRQRALLLALSLGASLVFLPTLLLALPGGTTLPEVAVPVVRPAIVVTAGDAVASVTTPLRWVGWAWLALALLAAIRAVRGAWRLRRLMRQGTDASPLVLQKIDALSRSMGLRPPHVKMCAVSAVPFVTGVLRPTLVLPASLLARVDEPALQLLLSHELTHFARGDHWIAAVVTVLRVPLAFHPAATWLHRELTDAREEAVDARVAGPDVLRAYASLLVDAAALARTLPVIPEVAMSGSSLERRITMLTDPVVRRPARIWPALIAFALVAWIPWVVPAAAGEASEPAQVIKVKVGAETTLMVPTMKRIAVKDPNIADVQAEGDTYLRIKGQSKGRTHLVIWTGPSLQRLEYSIEVE